MSDERMEAIRERLEGADNPGPWGWTQFNDAFAARRFVVPEGWDGGAPPTPHYPAVVAEVQHGFATCDLIAHAPSDLRYLLDRIEAQREVLSNGLLRDAVEFYEEEWQSRVDARDGDDDFANQTHAEIVALREALDNLEADDG